MEHVPHLQRMANEAWRGSPEHAALTAAIASLSAPQPPAEAQAQGGGEAQPFCRECGTRSTRHNPITVDLCARCAQRGTTPAPIGWVFQHDETGRMTFCENDGINTPDVFALLNPRHTLCGPAFTAPPSAPVEARLPPRKNEREADGKFRTVYLFDTPHEQGRFQQQVEAFFQQPAAVDGAMAFTDAAVDAIQSRMADLGFVVPVRVISDGVSAALAQQPAAAGEMAELVGLLDEVRSHFTRDDDLPDDLLPRIDAALAAQPGGSDNDR